MRELDPRRGQELGDEERVAAGQVVHLDGPDILDVGRRGELGHPGRGEPGQRHPGHRGPDERAQGAAQRVPVVEPVLPVGQQEQARQPGQPAGEHAQHVEGRVVRPVHVLHEQDGGFAAGRQDVEQPDEQLVAVRGGGQCPAGLPAEAAADVAERAEGARGEQVVAGSGEHPRLRGEPRQERLHQARLADPGLPEDQHRRTPGVAGARVRGSQEGQLGVALDQGGHGIRC